MERKDYKKIIFSMVGVMLLMAVIGGTYAFFNYTRTGTSNIIKTGRVSFNSEQGTAINLTNLFPIDVSEGIPNDATKVGTVTINITGDTEYGEGIEYLVSAVNVTNTVGSGQSAKILPISIDVEIQSNTENTPATTLGTVDEDYFTDRGSTTSYYKILAGDVIENNKELLVGYIAPGATGVDGNIVIRAYIDKSKILISDTYPARTVRNVLTTNYSSSDCETTLTGVTNASTYCATAADLQDAIDNEDLTSAQIALLVNAGIVEEYTDGTPTSMAEGKTVFTTSEWNSLQANGVSFQVKVEANQGTWVKNPIVCKRVTNAINLHTEICNQTTNYCAGDGYTGSNTTITYGNAVALGTDTLTTGDAFDCDVNGNGVVDTENGISTERFYYVSPYYDTQTETFDSTYATLIYYRNFVNGSPSDSGAAYASIEAAQQMGTCVNEYGCNWYGPITAVTHLPTTTTWNNITLKNTSRAILAENRNAHNLKTTSGGTLPVAFSYSGKAARLLTAQEVISGCGLNQVGNNVVGELSTNCQFLFEGTRYADSSNETYGPWLETPYADDSDSILIGLAPSRDVNVAGPNAIVVGIRPTIDVAIAKIAK